MNDQHNVPTLLVDRRPQFARKIWYGVMVFFTIAASYGYIYERGEHLRIVANHEKCGKQDVVTVVKPAEASVIDSVIVPTPPARSGDRAVLIDTEFSAKKVEAVRGRLATAVDACRHLVPKLQLCFKPVVGGKFAALATAGSGLTEADATTAHQCLSGYIPDAMIREAGKYRYPGCI